MTPPESLYDFNLSDPVPPAPFVSKQLAEQVFHYFRQSPLFRWQDANNDCEDRANALCMLLDAWGITNYKAWVFSGAYLQRGTGSLVNFWNYHVAAAVPVPDESGISIWVIDPATLTSIATIKDWATGVTQSSYSFHLVKQGVFYIFNPTDFRNGWHPRDRQNFKWTIQGLAGINGVSKTGKAQLVFKKKKIAQTEKALQKLSRCNPLG